MFVIVSMTKKWYPYEAGYLCDSATVQHVTALLFPVKTGQSGWTGAAPAVSTEKFHSELLWSQARQQTASTAKHSYDKAAPVN